MIIQPPPITVDPPAITVDPPALIINPPSFTATPPTMTVNPPSVSYRGKTYGPPAMVVTPPPMTVTPPSLRVDPPAITVDPPAITVQPPAVTIDPPVGQDFVVVDPPPVTVDPPAVTVDPPAITVTPPRMRISPPPFTVPASRVQVRYDPPGPAPPLTVTLDVPSFTVHPPAFDVTPPPVTVDVPSITADPSPVTVDPPAVVVNLGDFTWGDPRFTTVVRNGRPADRLNVVIIGDGYNAAQQALFQGDAQRVIDAFREIQPMEEYFRHFNFHRVDVISPEDGTDDPYDRPPRIRRTALHTFYSPLDERRLVGPDSWVKEVVAQSGAPCDEILVLVNTRRRGGGTAPTMEVAYASRNSGDFPRIVIHEAGHSIANLADEYNFDSPDVDWPDDWVLPSVLPWVNVDTDPNNPKWQPWLTDGVDRPTPDTAPEGTVGAFEGASYTPLGVYRPMERCMMRANRDDFCVVCAEAWIATIYRRSRLADAFFPQVRANQALRFLPGRPIRFSAQAVRPAAIRASWFTRDRFQRDWQARQQTETYQGFTTAFNLRGQYQVRVVLEDDSVRIRTPAVRDLARQEHVWSVAII